MLYSHNQKNPISKLPHRIVLSNGLTRTDSSTFTSEELIDAGYVEVEEPPTFDPKTERLEWTGTEWNVTQLSDPEVQYIIDQEWFSVMEKRNILIQNIEWRIMRHQSEVRLGITTTTDNISDLDTYVQELRDITDQPDPFNIVWPNPPT